MHAKCLFGACMNWTSKIGKLRPAAAGKASLSYRHPVYWGGGGLEDFESSTELKKKADEWCPKISGCCMWLMGPCYSMLFINNQSGYCLIRTSL